MPEGIIWGPHIWSELPGENRALGLLLEVLETATAGVFSSARCVVKVRHNSTSHSGGWRFRMEVRTRLDESQTFMRTMQLILLTCGFHICKFIYSLISLCNSKSIWWHFLKLAQSREKFELAEANSRWKVGRSQPRWNKVMSCFFISAFVLSTSFFFVVYLVSCLLYFFSLFIFCFLLIILLFEMTPKLRAEVLASVSKCKKAVICLTEKI